MYRAQMIDKISPLVCSVGDSLSEIQPSSPTEEDTVCDCGKVYENDMDLLWLYYPRFDKMLCKPCVEFIHYRLAAEYTLKLVGEFNFRKWTTDNIFKYTHMMKLILSKIHLGMLNNKSAIHSMREYLDESTPIDKINLIDIKDLDKVKKSNVINKGITQQQAKDLTRDKNVAQFFEIVAHCLFCSVEDFGDYYTESNYVNEFTDFRNLKKYYR